MVWEGGRGQEGSVTGTEDRGAEDVGRAEGVRLISEAARTC